MLVLGAATTPVVLGVGLVLVQGLTIAAWYGALDVPGRIGGVAVAAAAALAADLTVLTAGAQRPLAGVPVVLALAVPAGLVHQLARRDGRVGLNASLAATVALVALTALGSAYLAADAGRHGGALAASAALGAGLAGAAMALRHGGLLPTVAGLGLGVLAGAAAGLVVGAVTDLGAGTAVAVAAAGAGVGGAGALFGGRAPHPSPLLAGALPVLAAAPVSYVLGRLLAG